MVWALKWSIVVTAGVLLGNFLFGHERSWVIAGGIIWGLPVLFLVFGEMVAYLIEMIIKIVDESIAGFKGWFHDRRPSVIRAKAKAEEMRRAEIWRGEERKRREKAETRRRYRELKKTKEAESSSK